jgi:hypothetical protein
MSLRWRANAKRRHVGYLVAAARTALRSIQVAGGDFGPAGDRAGGQVHRQVAQDPQPGFRVMSLAGAARPAGTVPLAELAR